MMIYPSLPLSGWGPFFWILGFAIRFYLATLAKKGGVGVSNCREHELNHPLIYMAITLW